MTAPDRDHVPEPPESRIRHEGDEVTGAPSEPVKSAQSDPGASDGTSMGSVEAAGASDEFVTVAVPTSELSGSSVQTGFAPVGTTMSVDIAKPVPMSAVHGEILDHMETSSVDEDACSIPDKKRCTATSKQSGRRCKRRRSPGREVCIFHGGKSLRGVSHPNYQGRGYAKDLPVGMREAYERCGTDQELLSMREDVRLRQLRVSSLVSRLGGGEAGSQWNELKAAREQFRIAMQAGDQVGMTTAMRAICDLIDRGAAQEDQWAEINAAQESKARMAMREWKRLVDLRQLMTSEQVMALVVAIMASVRRNVHQVDALRAIANDLQMLLDGNKPRRPEK
jgi:hypothetical protein